MMFTSLKDVEAKFLEMKANSNQARQEIINLGTKVLQIQEKHLSHDYQLQKVREIQARLEKMIKLHLGFVDSEDIPMRRSDEFDCKSIGSDCHNQEQQVLVDYTSSNIELVMIAKCLGASMSQSIRETPKATLKIDIKEAGENISMVEHSTIACSTPCVGIPDKSAPSSGQISILSPGANGNGLLYGNTLLRVFSKTGIINIAQLSQVSTA